MVVVKKKPPLGEDGLPDLSAPPKYRLYIDAKESNAITIPPSAASDSIEDVVHGIKVMAKESLRAFGCMPLVSSKDRATWASIAKGES